MTKRVKTGIKGFDELVEGGLPEGSTVLICGQPGTGKTIFCLEFLYRGALLGENGLYITLEEQTQNLVEQASQFSWDTEKLVKQGKLTFKSIPVDMYDINIVQTIADLVARTKAKRLVIDSLSALFMNAGTFRMPLNMADSVEFSVIDDGSAPASDHVVQNSETFIYNFIYRLGKLGTTTLVTADSPGDGKLTKDGVSEFVCDGLISINMRDFGKTIMRTLEVRKMRRTALEPGFMTMKFSKTGVQITPFSY